MSRSKVAQAFSPAIGFRVKSGFAIAVALRGPALAPVPLVRRVVSMSDPDLPMTKQPYHDGNFQTEDDPLEIAKRLKIVERSAAKSIKALLKEDWLEGSRCRASAIVVGSIIDPAKVGNPHIRAHAHEGRLFRVVLEEALRGAGVTCQVIVEKQLAATAAARLARAPRDIARTLDGFGKALGSPWRAEEKAAATAAWLSLL